MISLPLMSAITVGLSIILVAMVLLAHWVWNPPQRTTAHADAIVVLAYGQDRLKLGRELAEDGVSDNLVLAISNGTEQRIAERRLLVLSPEELAADPDTKKAWIEECDADFGTYQTECIFPVPDSTGGEAAATEALMQENGWDSIVLVTERSHMHRALRTFDACTTGEVYGAVTDRSGPWYRDLRRTVYEMGALSKSVVARDC